MEPDLNKKLQKFWELEELPMKRMLSPEEIARSSSRQRMSKMVLDVT